jgi:hypothetical protein
VTSTVTIPAGTRMVGEAWSVLAGKGPAFQDQDNPQVIFKVGEEGSQGILEITDIVFSTVGPGDLNHVYQGYKLTYESSFTSCWCDYHPVECQGTIPRASRRRNVGFPYQVCIQ